MRLLFIEDENEKRKNIENFLRTYNSEIEIVMVTSIMKGIIELKKEIFDLVLLDMSLPLYDMDGEDEDMNEFDPFGGLEILAEIDRKELRTGVLVITAFDVIEDDTKSFSLGQLDEQMREDYSANYKGCIHYDESSIEWKTKLMKIIER